MPSGVVELLMWVSAGKMFGGREKAREGLGVFAGRKVEDGLMVARKAAFAGAKLAVCRRCQQCNSRVRR
jgi:hypothetical protein